MKKKVLFNKAIRYKSLDPTGKGKPRRKSFSPNQQIGINHLVLQRNKIFCLADHFGINHWILHKNKREQNGLTCSVLHKNKKEQNGISH